MILLSPPSGCLVKTFLKKFLTVIISGRNSKFFLCKLEYEVDEFIVIKQETWKIVQRLPELIYRNSTVVVIKVYKVLLEDV